MPWPWRDLEPDRRGLGALFAMAVYFGWLLLLVVVILLLALLGVI